MKIKGSAVKTISQFVKEKYTERYDEWLDALPEESQQIIKNPIFVAEWYPIKVAASIPTQLICEMFYNNQIEGALASGRFSAEIALKGVYRIFVRISSPKYIVGRVVQIGKFPAFGESQGVHLVPIESAAVTGIGPRKQTLRRIQGGMDPLLSLADKQVSQNQGEQSSQQ